MPRLFQKRSGTWSEILSVFQKQGGTWTEILNIFQKIGGTWTKVFAGLKVPGNTVPPTITGSGYLFGTLTNTNLGTWTNTPTSYARQWRRGNPSAGGGEPSGYSNISGATSSTYVTTSDDNGKYIVCQVTATNAVGSNAAVSNLIYVSKYAPVSLLPYTFSGTPIVGATLTALEQIGSWKSTTTNTDDTYPDTFEYEWSYTDGTIIQSSTLSAGSYPRNINSSSFLIDSVDLNKQIRVRVTGTNTGGSATSGYTTSGTVTTTYSFSFGNTLYVGSNGYIGLDNGGSAAGTAGSGRNINIWNEDLVQYRLQEYSDSSNYHLYFRAYRYQSPLVQSAINALDYQIKFYTGQPYCDVYLVRKGSSVPTYIDNPGYYSNGLAGGTGIVGPFSWTAGSVLRVYFNGTLASTSAASWTSISDTLWKDITTSQIDDSFTSVVTSANQQAPFPVNTSLPTLTTDTGNFSAGSIITVNSGTWTGTNSFSYELLYGTTTPIATDSTSTKTLANTNQYTITIADATAPSYYFRGRVTGYSGSGQTGNSAIALSTTSVRSTITPSTTISLGTETKTGFTVSGTASPRISGVAYVSISKIEIFNSSYSSVAVITTGLPTVNATTGGWSYIWSGGSGGNTYYAKATSKSTDSDQTSVTTDFSASITTTASKPPTAPTSITAGTKTNTSIAWSWTAPVATSTNLAATGYEYNHTTSATTPTSGWTAQTGTSVTISSLTKNTTYYMHVRATNADGTSDSAYNSASTNNDNFYTVTFDVNGSGGTAPSSVTQSTVGGSVTLASAITRTGYTFGGWNTATDGTGTNRGAGTSFTPTADVTLYAKWTVAYAPVVWGSMTAPAFNRLNSSSRLRWGWNNQLPTSGDYTASNITWEWRYSSTASTAGFITSGTRPNRSGGGLTVGTSTYNNRVSSLSGDYSSPGNIASANEPVTFSTSNRFLSYRAVVVGSDGITYRSNYSDWV
jgi:uncharacterized repeat protein (TIGR02543 family)